MSRRQRIGLALLALFVVVPAAAYVVPAIGIKMIGGWYYSVPSGNMRPTLRPGDRVLAMAFEDVSAGMVVVYVRPQDPSVEFIGRIIGLPGESVQMKGGKVYIDRRALPTSPAGVKLEAPVIGDRCLGGQAPDQEGQCVAEMFEEQSGRRSYRVLDTMSSPADNTQELPVPDGTVFILGDNRDNSLDSRFPQVGTIPIEDIRYEITRIHFSADFRWDRLFKRVE